MPPPLSSSRGTRDITHLSQIIGVEPDKEPRCAGYAYSQRRRCHAQTNLHDRNRALHLLNIGTEELRAGRTVDHILAELALRVLCIRNHRSQARGLTQRWKEKVQLFIQAQARSSRRRATEARNRLHRAPVTEPAPVLREAEINIPSPLRNLWTLSDFFTRVNSLFDSMPAFFRFKSGKAPGQPVSPKQVRQPITGSCSICLEPLRKSSLYSSSDNGTYKGVVEQRKPRLTYCKGECGNNFHLKCVQKWLKYRDAHNLKDSEPTCPICRSIWTN